MQDYETRQHLPDPFVWNEPVLGITEVKRQHTVPRLLLRQFANANGRIRAVDLASGREFATSAENLAVQSRFYDVEINDQTLSTENWLARLENDSAGIIRLLSRSPEAIGDLPFPKQVTFARFIAALIFRSPAKRTELQSQFDELDTQLIALARGQFLSQFGSVAGAAKFAEWSAGPFHERYGESEPTEIGKVTTRLLGDVQGFANLLLAAPWRIGRALGTRKLYTSDNPVAAYWPPTNVSWEPRAFAEFEYYLPLSPTLLLKIARRKNLSGPITPLSLKGRRTYRDFGASEVSLARHIVTHQALQFLYGASKPVDRACATTCLEAINEGVRHWVSTYLGPEPLPPWVSG